MSTLPVPIAAFFAGLISFLSPCVLPLVPGYVSMISGVGLEELKSAQAQLMRRVMINSIAFILGFSVVFIALGAAATGLGQVLGVYKHTLARVAGVVIILFGLHLTGIFKIKALYTDARLHNVKGGSTPAGAFVIGFAFAFGWTPCLGPVLATILGFASQQDTVGKGVLLLAVYSMGLAVPFLLTSLLMEQFLQFYSRFRSYMHAIEVASGGLMIALGVLLLIGRFTLISNWLSFLGKFEVWLEGAVINSTAIAILVGAVALAIVVYVGYRASQRSNEGVVMKRNPLALVVVAFVVALMLYFAYHQARRNGTASAPRITQSTVAPDFSLESLDGPTMRLSDLRGKAVLLNFWATWCGPCKIEMPWFVDLQKKYGSQGLQIVGVAMDDASKDDIAKFAKDMGVNYPILIGKEAVGDQYGGVPALPETFLIGRDGKIVDKIIGLRGKSEIEDSIKKALDTRPATSQASATEKGSVPQ
ncbi:MAG TPA: cytochrome c biogenesis protein CcdA [Candidatus Dormibacteraeota bacterium]|jgi:cytochrome c-type biogenesis protein|nr:cytochrome c biogenesis protein CcdA [Candidatus Dormibacteraeota bacterium]